MSLVILVCFRVGVCFGYGLVLLLILHSSLKRDESCLVGSRDSGTSVSDGLVCDREFSQVHANHFWLHFHTAEHLSVVDTDDRSDHFGDDDHVSEVGLDTTGLFSWWGFLLGLSQALDKGHRLSLQTTGHSAAGAGADEIHELIVCEVQESIELDTAEGEFTKLALLTKLGNFFGVHDCIVSSKKLKRKLLAYTMQETKEY